MSHFHLCYYDTIIISLFYFHIYIYRRSLSTTSVRSTIEREPIDDESSTYIVIIIITKKHSFYIYIIMHAIKAINVSFDFLLLFSTLFSKHFSCQTRVPRGNEHPATRRMSDARVAEFTSDCVHRIISERDCERVNVFQSECTRKKRDGKTNKRERDTPSTAGSLPSRDWPTVEWRGYSRRPGIKRAAAGDSRSFVD